MIRLSVDTSFEHLGLCISKDDVVLAHHYSLCHRKNAKIIFNVLDDLLKNIGMEMKDVDVFVVNQGPGSYTGVRIGMGVVKTFAQVMNKPIVPINSLELIAAQILPQNHKFTALLNCTRKEIFHCDFKLVNGFPMMETSIQLSTLEIILEENSGDSVVLKRVSPERRKPEPLFDQLQTLPLSYPLPDALLLDKLGGVRFNQPDFDPNNLVHPLYIKKDVTRNAA